MRSLVIISNSPHSISDTIFMRIYSILAKFISTYLSLILSCLTAF
ncbi:hypothetical protein [Campylobacter lanienae]|nr:hypothetical protein [Campylobacter lanienae]